MARAHRHFVTGQIYHITHRCHKREFILKYAKDRHRWLQWLFEAKKRYGLVILNYTVTSNHIHLLVYDSSEPDVIPRSIQLIAGRVGQEYNIRKRRKGSFWEDRYHATIIESGEHLLRCIVYIDMNMVRARVVEHPDQWIHCGYREIQTPRRKCILIDYDRLRKLCGFDDFESFQATHRKWVETAVGEAIPHRESTWTQAVAVGNDTFVEKIKKRLKAMAIGRRISPTNDGWELREEVSAYNAFLGAQKVDMHHDNTYSWDDNVSISMPYLGATPDYRIQIDIAPIIEMVTIHSQFIDTNGIDISICEDPDDNKFIECAIAGKCNIIVTGDAHLLKLISYKDIKIIKPRAFIENYLEH